VACADFSSLKKIIDNRKRTAIISHQKIFNYRKKIESIGPDHYRIALSLRINYRKMFSMRCDCYLCGKLVKTKKLKEGSRRKDDVLMTNDEN